MSQTKIQDEKILLVLDLDGTLLNDDKELSAFSRNYLNEFLKDPNHYVLLNSARSIKGIEIISKYLFSFYDNLFLAGFNGAILTSNKTRQIIHKDLMKPEEVTAYFQAFHPTYLVFMDEEENTTLYNPSLKELGLNPDFLSNNTLTFNYCCAYVCSSIQIPNQYTSDFFAFYTNQQQNDLYVSYVLQNKKLNAVWALTQYLTLNHNNVYVYGDGYNDVEMLKFFKNGAKMLNGDEYVSQIDKPSTTFSNHEDGAIKHFMQQISKANPKNKL